MTSATQTLNHSLLLEKSKYSVLLYETAAERESRGGERMSTTAADHKEFVASFAQFVSQEHTESGREKCF